MIESEYVLGKTLLIDKPLEWTSFDVVKKVKFNIIKPLALKKLKVGHAGTLDPLASGLLIVCTGKKTKTIPEIQNQPKKYEGIFCLGATTPSFDLETEPENFKSFEKISESEISLATKRFIGEIKQVPPIFSAKKINGKRAYLHARKGEHIQLKENDLTIYDFQITNVDLPEVHFYIHCSKGTYIRSLANDFGAALGCGAYLKALRRTAIGDYHVKNALSIESWQDQIKKEFNN